MYFNLRRVSLGKFGLIWEEYNEAVPTVNLVKREDLSISYVGFGNKEVEGLRENKVIEGDNLHALTYLKDNRYKIDQIIIDPPYNTGKDFTYKDNRVNIGDEFKHSKWLSFMNQRLLLAKELLATDGVIYISIDDHEQAYLKVLCDQIFGSENFISTLVWKKGGGKSDSKFLANKKEYCHIYQNGGLQGFNKQTSPKAQYKYEDDRGSYSLRSFCMGGLTYSPTLDYAIEAPDGTLIYAGWDEQAYNIRKSGVVNKKDWCWTLSKKEYEKRKEDNRIVFKNMKGKWKVYYKAYYENKSYPYPDIYEEVGNAASAAEIKDLFGSNVFNYAKPKEFIKFLINLYPKKDAVILDFFAGSGTTGQAVLELNQEDGGTRSFILCTNNEVSDLAAKKYLVDNNKISGKTNKDLDKAYKEYQNKPEWLTTQEQDDFQSLGICQSVTIKRLVKVVDRLINKGNLNSTILPITYYQIHLVN